jgi:hypothetical protein
MNVQKTLESPISNEDFNKAANIIRKRQEYNKQYYANKKTEQNKPNYKCGRRAIEEITPERVAETLEKYKIKCKNQNKKLNTPEEIKK